MREREYVKNVEEAVCEEYGERKSVMDRNNKRTMSFVIHFTVPVWQEELFYFIRMFFSDFT